MIFKFLHIALVFSGIALIYGTEILLHRIGRSGDTRTIRTAFTTARPIGAAGPAVFWVGVAFGVVTGIVNGFDMLAPWLLTTYVLVGAVLVGGITITVPWMMQVTSLAVQAVDGPPSAELQAALHRPAVARMLYASVLVDLAIVGLMVFKPGA